MPEVLATDKASARQRTLELSLRRGAEAAAVLDRERQVSDRDGR